MADLFAAARDGQLDEVRRLLARGASVAYANADGSTPLFIAACQGHADVVRLLLGAGAAVERASEDGWWVYLANPSPLKTLTLKP